VIIPFADGERALEGLYLAGEGPEAPGAVVAPPHPLMGGSMDHPVVSEIAYACQAAGIASLRFNWRGVGASSGEASGAPEDLAADFSSAVSQLEDTLPGSLLAAGYSAGAAAAVLAAGRHRRIRRLVLVAPPLAMLDRAALAEFAGSVLILTGERDPWSPPAEAERLAASLPRGGFQLVPEADHFFATGLADIARALSAWL
jgi:alpha/beta superfamily hydrolase